MGFGGRIVQRGQVSLGAQEIYAAFVELPHTRLLHTCHGGNPICTMYLERTAFCGGSTSLLVGSGVVRSMLVYLFLDGGL